MADLTQLDVSLERDGFLRRLLRELAGSLQDVVGLDDAAGYISVVGAAMGEQIDAEYRTALQVDRLDRQQVSDVLVDLKRRIKGDFFIIEEGEDKIVLGNRACPFGAMVKDRPSLCMMTSNVFGHISAQNLGFAAVELKSTIARGDPGCLVVVHLKPQPLTSSATREYYKRDDDSTSSL
ncbi:MAG: methanogen output domain 1-containing protein [Pseudolabrys sp.]|nr:methanogen output domain 1-containing protein [Pseudolabrys sp.]